MSVGFDGKWCLLWVCVTWSSLGGSFGMEIISLALVRRWKSSTLVYITFLDHYSSVTSSFLVTFRHSAENASTILCQFGIFLLPGKAIALIIQFIKIASLKIVARDGKWCGIVILVSRSFLGRVEFISGYTAFWMF